MTSNKPLNNETIDDLLKNKDEVYNNEIIETPDYSYWASQMPLDWSYQVRNIWWWLKIKNWQINISWIWSISITWLWFKPKYIEFESAWASSMSIMKSDWNYYNWIRIYNINNIPQYSTTSRAVELYNQSWEQYILVDLSSFNEDWFTLNKTRVDFNITLRWTAFW